MVSKLIFPIFYAWSAIAAPANPANNDKLAYQRLMGQSYSFQKGVDLEKELRSFVAQTKPSRLVGTPGHAKAREYLRQRVREVMATGTGLLSDQPFAPDWEYARTIYTQDFEQMIKGKFRPNDPEYIKWNRFTQNMLAFVGLLEKQKTQGLNLVWEKAGKTRPEKVLVLGAHYDSMTNDFSSMQVKTDASAPGADDNGSGVVVALKLIEQLSKLDLPITVKVVFFDFQEVAGLGSRYFATLPAVSGQELLGMIGLEQLGYDTKTKDKERRFGNLKAYGRTKAEDGEGADQKLFNAFHIGGTRLSPGVQFKLEHTSFNIGDQNSFWAAQKPALLLSQNWEDDFNQKGFHTADDLPEMLNFKTLKHVQTYVLGGVLCLAFNCYL